MMSRLWLITFHILLVLSIFTYIAEARTASQLKVKLDHGGVLVGRHLTSLHGRNIRAFLGVPYAQPPVDKLRFKAPVPYGSWDGERLATQDLKSCPQMQPFFESTEFTGTEDCLYLNVYTPEEPRINKSLPVMVYFYGGLFYMGSAQLYSPKFLMDKDIIYVPVNYRLGPLGFLSTETLDCPGNNGLKDQTAALAWVQKNIAVFGGDPNRVTIFGESAGGAIVTYHLISKKSQGLFHKAISQSGTFYNPWAKPASPGEPAQKARKLAQIVGCNDVDNGNWPNILECLRSKSAENITVAFSEFFKWYVDPLVPFGPVIEPEHYDAFLTNSTRKQDSASVPLMIGFTSDEGLLRTTTIVNQAYLLEDIKKRFEFVFPILLGYDNNSLERQNQITKAVVDFYLKDGLNFDRNNFQNFTDLTSDALMFSGIDKHIRKRISVKSGAPTYLYIFDHKGSASFSELYNGGERYYGCSHGDDLLFLFPFGEDALVTSSPNKRDQDVREVIIDLWVNFASTSDPTPAGTKLPKWSAVRNYPPKFMRISSKNERDPLLKLSGDYPLARINFWHNV